METIVRLYIPNPDKKTAWLTKTSRNQVEFIRADVFIKKTCDWMERNGSYYIGFEQGQPCVTEELIKSLKKYLEEQV